jgi:hypothetical protein
VVLGPLAGALGRNAKGETMKAIVAGVRAKSRISTRVKVGARRVGNVAGPAHTQGRDDIDFVMANWLELVSVSDARGAIVFKNALGHLACHQR